MIKYIRHFWISLILFYYIPGTVYSQSTYSEETRSGIRYISNITPAWGNNVKIKLEFVRKYGDLETDDENYQFYRPKDADLDPAGNVYILDAGNYMIKTFNRNGIFISSFGNKGQGPGEFTGPSVLDVAPDGRIIVNDLAMRKVQIFDKNGKYLQQIRHGSKLPQKILALNSGNIAVSYRKYRVTEENQEYLISVFNKSGNLLKELTLPRDYDDPTTTFFGNSLFIAADKNDNIFVCFEFQNRIEKYSNNGYLIFYMSRKLEYEETSVMGKKQVSSEEGPLFALSINNISTGIQVDHKGRIWTGTWKRQETEKDKAAKRAGRTVNNLHMFEIFDDRGILIGRIQDGFYKGQPFRIIKNRLFLIDSNLEMAVYEYRITGNDKLK